MYFIVATPLKRKTRIKFKKKMKNKKGFSMTTEVKRRPSSKPIINAWIESV